MASTVTEKLADARGQWLRILKLSQFRNANMDFDREELPMAA